MNKLLLKEQKRLREHAALTVSLSPDLRPEILRKNIAEFTRDLMTTMGRKRHIKNWLLVLIETDGEQS